MFSNKSLVINFTSTRFATPFAFATKIAFSLTSLAVTAAVGSCFFTLIAIAPLPVHKSSTLLSFARFATASARSSVSGRGISTFSFTRSFAS